MSSQIIRCENLSFTFPGAAKSIFEKVTFSISPGETVALLGLNGAGKTTLLRLLTGLLRPSGGTVELLSRPAKDLDMRTKKKIRAIFGNRPHIFAELSVDAFLDAYAAMYGATETSGDLTERLGVNGLRGRTVRSLSLGERMRVELAAALQGKPEVVFLDEPGIGLDVEAKRLLRETVAALAKQGVCVVMVTHDMQDISELRPRCLVLGGRRLVFDGNLAGECDGLGGMNLDELLKNIANNYR